MSNGDSAGFSRGAVAALLAIGVCSALAVPQLAALFSPLVFPALFLLVTLSLSLTTDRPTAILANPEPAVWGIMLWQLAFLPLLVILIGWAIGLPRDLHLMLLVTAASSSVFAAPTIANHFRLNGRLPINGMVVSTFLMPVALLVFDQALEGEALDFPIKEYVFRVALFLFLPLGISILINRLVKRLPKQASETSYNLLHAGAVISLLVFGIGIMDGVHHHIQTDPSRVLSLFLVAVGFGVIAIAGTACLFWSLGRDLLLSAIILSVHRNVGLTYAVIGTAIAADFAVYVAIFQIPMFLSPLFIGLGQAAYHRPRKPMAEAA